MRIVLLDYQGTLCPRAMEAGQAVHFVKDLQSQGDLVYLWTGSSTRDIQRETPGLAEAVDRNRSKWALGREILEELSYPDIRIEDISEVVVLDDDPDVGKGMAESFNLVKKGLARYVPAMQWKSLLLKEAAS